jgi:hypothetical protein
VFRTFDVTRRGWFVVSSFRFVVVQIFWMALIDSVNLGKKYARNYRDENVRRTVLFEFLRKLPYLRLILAIILRIATMTGRMIVRKN